MASPGAEMDAVSVVVFVACGGWRSGGGETVKRQCGSRALHSD